MNRPSTAGRRRGLGLTAAALIALGASGLQAQNGNQVRVRVTIENLAPERGTFQTPFWVGFHDGTFDIYDRELPASLFFSNDALERLAEDGATGPITEAFAQQAPNGVDATLVGPDGPLAPGDVASRTFVLDPSNPSHRYFSYASMVIPSNDFFVANGNPLAHRLFNGRGDFVAEDFFIVGTEVLDAGTEVNDEAPANTAFFGQAAPDTGVDQNGVVRGIGEGLRGFRRASRGGILATRRFSAANFLADGYPVARVSFSASPAVTADAAFTARLTGGQEVPAVDTDASGTATYALTNGGSRLTVTHDLEGLDNVTGAHLHLGAAGENGPVVAFLTNPRRSSRNQLRRLGRDRRIESDDLVGPFEGLPLDALTSEILAGNVYINIHTTEYPDGEVRGQLQPAAQ